MFYFGLNSVQPLQTKNAIELPPLSIEPSPSLRGTKQSLSKSIELPLSRHCEETKQSIKTRSNLPYPVIARHEAISFKIDRTSLSCHCEETKQSLSKIDRTFPLSLRGTKQSL
ncbi:hypothetical protein ACN4EE_23115 [Geminocystis sp. CENA526]|uniref:hypothetical protein n=1 Tax=Geminocystis sp. CENA526 TaxID=1355871 RepID=UPI003D6FD6C5